MDPLWSFWTSESARLFWPSVAGLGMVLAASATPYGRSARSQLVLAGSCAVVLATWYVLGMVLGFVPAAPLVRDAVALTLVAATAPLLAGLAGAALRARTRSTWMPVVLAGLVGSAWLLASPVLMLLAHCTSGDCL